MSEKILELDGKPQANKLIERQDRITDMLEINLNLTHS